ncbi:MAG: hypothetical protein ACFCUG_05285 [Thiotrichales bacterium]
MLLADWDPLCVADEPGAEGEYEDYVPEIVGLLVSGAGEAAIAARLTAIARGSMGLVEDAVEDRRVAAILIALGGDGRPCAGS